MSYFAELLSLNDITICKEKAQKLCSTFAELNKYKKGFIIQKNPLKPYRENYPLTCVFGMFIGDWEHFQLPRPISYHHIKEKNGIEILNAQPNATGSTYSNACQITIEQLKIACKVNGIKSTGNKKILLHALMKI